MLVQTLLPLAVIAIPGALLLNCIQERSTWLEWMSLSIPLGGGVISWLAFLISIGGVKINALSIGLLSLLLVLVVMLCRLMRQGGFTIARGIPGRSRVSNSEARPEFQGIRIEFALAGAFIVILSFSILFSLGRSYSSYDATAGWAAKGYGIAQEGSVYAADSWGMWGRAYPLNMPTQISLFMLFTGEDLPGSKLLFPIMYASVLIGCYRFWRDFDVNRRLAGLGFLFLATNPLIFLHSTIGYANLPFATYFVLGFLYCLEGILGDREKSRIIGGILLALASWTRAEGIAYCIAAVLALGLAVRISRRGNLGKGLWLIPTAVVWTSWYGFSWSGVASSHLGSAMGGFAASLLDGQLNLWALKLIIALYFSRGLDVSNLGFLLPMVALFLGAAILNARSRMEPVLTFLISGSIAAMGMPVMLFYVRSFTRWTDFRELLIRSFDRATIPAIIMSVVTAIMAFHLWLSPQLDHENARLNVARSKIS